MGRKLDLSGLSDVEAAHVLQVVQRDMRLRKREEERLCELKHELEEESGRCHLLSRQSCFNQRCCIRCCAPFTFLLNPKRPCGDCGYNVCRGCRIYQKTTKDWLCTSCQKQRLLKTQSLEWFYTNVKRRFKRFGSAKVLKTLYKKHLTEHSILSELTDGSGYEESVCNDGSVCGSDSTFYRQTEEHSMSETLSVARRVAEEAIDEAISKAEVDIYCQEKQNEAHYLREHRGELIDELAKTIVQKIIVRRKTLAQIKCEYDQDLTHTYYDHFVPSQPPGLWRSHSLSLLDSDSPGAVKSPLHSLKKDSSLSAWKSVDRLDNSVLKSPDGNWIALQSSPLSRPRLLTKRKSLVYSALERESGAVSAYEALDSDSDIRQEPDSSWGAVLKEIHKKMTSSDLLEDLDLDYVGGEKGSADFEGNWKANKALINKKVPVEMRKPASSRRTSIIDVNFNMEAGNEDEEEEEETSEGRRVRRNRRKRRSKRDLSALQMQDHSNNETPHLSDATSTPETLTSGATTPDLCGSDLPEPSSNQINQELTFKLQQLMGQASISDSSTNVPNSVHNSGDYMDVDEADFEKSEETEFDTEAKDRLYKLVAQSRLLYLSSTDDDLDKAGLSDEEEEEEDAQTSLDLKFQLCQLEQEVKSTQFSSTEDELDRLGHDEVPVPHEEQENLDVIEFSSTEEELDRVGSAEEAVDDAALWNLQSESVEQVRDLAGLVSICQFSSTEDELDRLGRDELSPKEEDCLDFDRRESIGDLDVNMFELRDDLTTGNYLEMTKAEDFELGVETECLDFDRRESIGDFDVSMFELKDKELTSLEGSGEHDAAEGAHFIESEAPCVESEIVLPESTNLTLEMPENDSKSASDSEEDEAEFNRIIDSMLMMTLDDMHWERQDVEDMNEKVKDSGSNVSVEGDEDDRLSQTVLDSVERADDEEDMPSLEESIDDISGKLSRIDGHTDVKEETNMVNDTVEELGHKTGESEAQMMTDKAENLHARLESNQEGSSDFRSQEGLLSPDEIKKRYSAESLRSITTEVLKVLNATERLLLQDTEDTEDREDRDVPTLSPNPEHAHLDQQLCRLEEHVYMAAGSVFDLEAELEDLEQCSRAVCSSTSHSELCFLEEAVATAAAKVQQSENQVSDISARIAALKSAGLNVDPQPTHTKTRTPTRAMTLDGSRQQRRLLPAPPTKDAKDT